MIVSSQAVCGRRSSPQVKAVSTTRHFGMLRALSRRSNEILARAADAVAEHRVVPPQPALQRLGVGIDQQLVGIEAVPVGRIERPVDAVAVKQVRPRVRQIAVPDLVGIFRKHDARLLLAAGAVEQAQFDLFGMRRKKREIDAPAVPGRAQRIGTARPHLRWRRHQRRTFANWRWFGSRLPNPLAPLLPHLRR